MVETELGLKDHPSKLTGLNLFKKLLYYLQISSNCPTFINDLQNENKFLYFLLYPWKICSQTLDITRMSNKNIVLQCHQLQSSYLWFIELQGFISLFFLLGGTFLQDFSGNFMIGAIIGMSNWKQFYLNFLSETQFTDKSLTTVLNYPIN